MNYEKKKDIFFYTTVNYGQCDILHRLIFDHHGKVCIVTSSKQLLNVTSLRKVKFLNFYTYMYILKKKVDHQCDFFHATAQFNNTEYCVAKFV